MAVPTSGQVESVFTVMRLLREDDVARGLKPDDTIACATCRRDRPAAGSVRYAGAMLCNGCATDYELLRLARLTPPMTGNAGALPA